jgi:hypothetical protein
VLEIVLRLNPNILLKKITLPPYSALSLVPINNTCSIRFTAAAGTNLARAYLLFNFIIFNKGRSLQGFSPFAPFRNSFTEAGWIALEGIVQDSLLQTGVYRRYFKPIVADHSSKSTKHRRLG